MNDPWKRKEVIGDATLYLGDARYMAVGSGTDTLITDPVWPDASTNLQGASDPLKLWQQFWNGGDTENGSWRNYKRVAVHLGCDSDPRFLSPVPLPFFRVCWLKMARPHYKGRLLYGSDVLYLFGEPPLARDGQHLISGEVCSINTQGREAKHPCPRKIEHVRRAVGWWTNPTDTVFDPFMGSGTTGVACAALGRAFIGIEIEPIFFDEACERITNAQRQKRMFV